jgi:SAM-dependent methyltransferase
MKLIDVVNRSPRPAPWTEGEKIPWNEPGFSARMLREHLSQEHDAASRRFEIIDLQVEWISEFLPGGRAGQVLDMGCGPGLYASRLAKLGCKCTGIDFSPASIAYAQEQARAGGLDCHYIQGDLRTTAFGNGYDLAMFIFGELNVFRPQDARLILQKAFEALNSGGRLVLEPHTFEAVRNIGGLPPRWYSASSGLFSENPHLYFQEYFWDEATLSTIQRYFIIDALSGEVTRYSSTMQAYDEAKYRELIQGCGFQEIQFHPSLEGKEIAETLGLLAITARK